MSLLAVDTVLATWARQGDVAASARTYEKVKAAIVASPLLRSRRVRVYLQGSYANTTNIRDDSDVDVVVQSSASFFYEPHENLSLVDWKRIQDSISPAEYRYDDFRGDVLHALRSAFPRLVEEGNKAIKVHATQGCVDADVVPAFDHRAYTSVASYVDGMKFVARDGQMFVNFPKQHRANGEAKNGRCDGNFKPTVRILKNLRSALYDAGALPDESIPSYYLECLISNASDAKFYSHDLRGRVADVLADLTSVLIAYERGWGEELISLNGIVPLFGDGNTQWNTQDARTFVDAAWAWLLRA